MRIIAALALIALAGCAADPAKVEAVADEEAQRLAAPSQKLSTFADFRLDPMTFSTAIQNEGGKMEEGREFEGNLSAKIQPLLDQWNAADTGGQDTLVIKPELVKLKIVSGGARFWAGAFAGDSFIDMNLRLVAEGADQEIANVRVSRDADAMTGGWSVGKSDQNLDEYIVTIVHEYLESNY